MIVDVILDIDVDVVVVVVVVALVLSTKGFFGSSYPCISTSVEHS